MMILPNTKQAEKEYLGRSGSSAWERSKPFSSPGFDTLDESAHMLHDFAVAMLTLAPAPDDLILDLGAGGCWCSDLLGRLNRSSVAVDISLDMLRAGRTRPGTPIRAVAGDMESLPFQSGVFQKAVCLSAIHHVPNIPRALEEVARVLSPDGEAFFSEPGEGHAQAPESSVAVSGYGVLEQDILIGPFMRHCESAGFVEVRVQPLSHAVPGFGLKAEEWDAWQRLATSIRPRRALGKLRSAVAELFGIGKGGPLFEEALAVSMVRTLRQVVGHHPVIVARKRLRVQGDTEHRWRAALDVQIPVSNDGESLAVEVTATNIGSGTWRPSSKSGIGHVALGVQLLDADGRMIIRDYHRVSLPHMVAPRERVVLPFRCPRPEHPGPYVLKFDLVAEGVSWFELTGSAPATARIDAAP